MLVFSYHLWSISLFSFETWEIYYILVLHACISSALIYEVDQVCSILPALELFPLYLASPAAGTVKGSNSNAGKMDQTWFINEQRYSSWVGLLSLVDLWRFAEMESILYTQLWLYVIKASVQLRSLSGVTTRLSMPSERELRVSNYLKTSKRFDHSNLSLVLKVMNVPMNHCLLFVNILYKLFLLVSQT